ncbi:CinA family protein [Demequina sp. SO4-13]|uniref:CinA family protein n=1 Tax=Demequina sp. SO4-13 TaxID=3401027 RepID=UPI003AF9B5CD
MSRADADAVLILARAVGVTVATAESLTGGSLCAELVEVPGASESLRGGVVSYVVEAKHDVLGVSQALLDGPGPVSREVAQAMASGVRRAMGADMGIATTGVAGPEPHGGKPPGTVWVAVDLQGEVAARLLHLDGDRGDVSRGSVDGALALAREVLTDAVART